MNHVILAFTISLGSLVTANDVSHDVDVILVGTPLLDAPLRLEATVKTDQDSKDLFYFDWKASTLSHETVASSPTSNWSLTFPSNQFSPRQIRVTVKVYKERDLVIKKFKYLVATGSITFELRQYLSGTLKPETSAVPVGKRTPFRADVDDPLGYLEAAQMSYYWMINGTNYGVTKENTFDNSFKMEGHSLIAVTVIARFKNGTEDHGDVLLSRNSEPDPDVKFGTFQRSIKAQFPVTKMNVTGERWLKQGDLINLTLTCDGSGPWTYCWNIKPEGYNITQNETCFDAQQIANQCLIDIFWFIRDPGTLSILVQTANGVSIHRQLIPIHIYAVHHQLPLSLVVIPVCSAMAALVAFAAGVFAFLTFKRNMSVETADFDFCTQDEQLEYKSFWERLRESMANAFNNTGDTISHVSSISSRSMQQNAAGIHYGSIT